MPFTEQELAELRAYDQMVEEDDTADCFANREIDQWLDNLALIERMDHRQARSWKSKRKYQRRYREAHKDDIAEYQRRYREAHKMRASRIT